jgi:hypothetical protein
MNHHPTSRYRRAIVATSITGLLVAAGCGIAEPNVQTDLAPAAPETAQRELDDLEDSYRAGASEIVPQSDPFAINVEERTAPDTADHQSQTGPSDQPTRPANGPHPF